MRKPETLTIKDNEAAKCCDAYEYSMANVNIQDGSNGVESIFLAGPRELPANKIVGEFEHKGIKYQELAKRKYMIAAGLEQAVAFVLNASNDSSFTRYLGETLGWNDKNFIDWAFNLKFGGDIYALKEGTPFFSYQPLMKIREKFEEAQIFESIILSLLSRESQVATSANDMSSQAMSKIFLEGASRRGCGPEDSLRVARASLIGGFQFSSFVKFGEHYNVVVGGTHGHSYILLQKSEVEGFRKQAKFHKEKVCFLLDTFNSKNAIEHTIEIIKELNLKHFGFRIDSGDLLVEAQNVHRAMKKAGFERSQYTLFASDDLTASRIRDLEDNSADIDKYLAGTFIANNPKTPGFVYKLTSKELPNGTWEATAKYSSNIAKGTLPNNIQVYRVIGSDGFYKKDFIGLVDEDMSHIASYEDGEIVERLLIPIVLGGKQVYDFPLPQDISKYRAECLKKFKDIENYEVELSEGLKKSQLEVKERIEKFNSVLTPNK